MSRLVVKCPKCEHQETVMSSRAGAELPPCPRCEDFVRMMDVTPAPGQTMTVISTATPVIPKANEGDEQGVQPRVTPAPLPSKRRDPRDYGPEPRS